MVLNSTIISNNSLNEDERASPSTVQMVVNTTDFIGKDLEEYITLSERIQRCSQARQSKQKQSKPQGNTLKAIRTREEFFEAITLDDDRYLEAMEHNTSYDYTDTVKPPKDRKALVKSIENLMKYFDEDIPVTSDSSAKATPVKKTTRGRVASLVASFRSKNKSTSSPHLNKRKKYQCNATANIQELKKKYESSKEEEVNNSPSPPKVKIKSPKPLRKTKVKQMASELDNKSHRSIETNSNESPRTSASLSSDFESPIKTSTLKTKTPKFSFKYPKFIAKLPNPRPIPLVKGKTKSASIASLASSISSSSGGADKKSNPLLQKLKRMPSLSSLLGHHSPRMKRKQLEKEKQSGPTCLVAENVFSQLSVKDKALLYNKFIEDMAKQNPKFGKHAQALETHVKKEMQRGEVVIEKQNSVKYLRDSLEAKFNRQNARTSTWQRFKRSKPSISLDIPPKSKEYEDILQSSSCSSPELGEEASSCDPLHITTLTVVLRNSPDDEKEVKCIAKNPVKKNVTFEDDVKCSPSTLKRSQKLLRASSAVEPMIQPKKIRRSKQDRFRPKIVFKNAHLEQLFYHWLKEQNGVAFDITAIGNQQNVIEILAANSTDDVLPAEEFQKMLEAAISNLEGEQQDAIVLIKNAMDDEQVLEKSVIELELPLNITNKESESDAKENLTISGDSQTDLNAQDATQPLRKRKLRRNISLRRNNSMLETATQQATTAISTTTDSDSDAKAEKSEAQQQPQSSSLPKFSKCNNYVKQLIFKTLDQQQNPTIRSNELSIVELDSSWMRKVNSPSKIKNAYTLTVISSPSPAAGSGSSEDDLPTQKCSRSWPSLTAAEIINKDRRLKDENDNIKQEATECKLAQEKLKQLMDNFIDQGFETGSNDMESPLKLTRKPSNPQDYSTPNKTKSLQQDFNTNDDSILSPIRHSNSRRQPSNLNTTVIREHKSTEDLEKLNASATFLIEQQTASHTIPICSQFWITCGEFTAALSIQYYEAEHLMLLSNIFTQKIVQDQTIDFGIDQQKFSWNDTAKLDAMQLELPYIENCSQYWFATGGTLLPFSGKEMSPEKITNFFNYIRSFMSDNKSSLRFGIDGYDFSTSQEHSKLQHLNLNSMFYGLNSLATPASASPTKTSDLDASDFESEEFDPSLTFSALNSQQQCDSVSLKTQPEYDSSLDCMEQILSDAKLLNLSKSETDKLAMEAQLTVPHMLTTLQNQKSKLETLEDRMQQYSSSTLDMQKFKVLNQNSPEIMRKLRSAITAIENIGHNCGFNTCTLQQLESFMFFLSRYADLCLASCTHHIEQIMEVILTQRATLPIQN